MGRLPGLVLLTVACGLLPNTIRAAERARPTTPAHPEWGRAPEGEGAGLKVPPDFHPDPRSVQRYGPAYRYPQAGWIVLHIEGDPYARGYQHGRLLAPEIAAHIRCFATMLSPRAPAEGWKLLRTLVNSLFLRRYHQEYLEEMKGIADGASAVGARFDRRPVDLLDVVALNAWPEVDTLDSALEATPTGLEGLRFGAERPLNPPPPKPMHCSAFAATGPATADGKIVFGHITMFNLYPSNFFNIWLDVQPSRGHRVLMQSYPGGIQSGLDYYLNDAGLLVCETTIAQTHLDSRGLTVASRIRQALQYADSIDGAVAILGKDNNGLYTNEWLLADVKTNEIAMYELGTHKSHFYRSSRKEWFGGTEGFYWGCNNTKDLQVRLETVASMEGRPANPVFAPSDRDRCWLRLYEKYKGKIDADFGKVAFTTAPVVGYHSVDAKFTTSDLARDLKTWALFGPPLGRTWKPTPEERYRYLEIRPLVSHPWTVLHAGAPPSGPGAASPVVDLHDPGKRQNLDRLREDLDGTRDRRADPDRDPPTVPAWHGTLLPHSDADVWLAAAFADYEKIVALEKALREREGGELKGADRDRVAVALFGYRSLYELGARAGEERPLARTRADLRSSDWYKVALGKGVLLLHGLRGRLGGRKFDRMMDDFGRAHAGEPVTTAQFRTAAEQAAGKELGWFFEPWLGQTGLPALKDKEPAGDNGGPFSVLSFQEEVEQALIVYGTRDETPSNREAAEALQQAIRAQGCNVTVPIKSDREVSGADLKSHHLLLIGRPDSNPLVAHFREALPVTFGPRSFVVRNETYAHPDSAVIAAAENPANRRFSVVVVAGLDAASTLRAAPRLGERSQRPAEVVVLPHGRRPRSLVVPARERTRKLGKVLEQERGRQKQDRRTPGEGGGS